MVLYDSDDDRIKLRGRYRTSVWRVVARSRRGSEAVSSSSIAHGYGRLQQRPPRLRTRISTRRQIDTSEGGARCEVSQFRGAAGAGQSIEKGRFVGAFSPVLCSSVVGASLRNTPSTQSHRPQRICIVNLWFPTVAAIARRFSHATVPELPACRPSAPRNAFTTRARYVPSASEPAYSHHHVARAHALSANI